MNRHDQDLSDEVVALINRLTSQARRRERRYAVAAALFGIIAVISATGGWLAYEDSRNTVTADVEAREDLALAVEALDSLAGGIAKDLAALDVAPVDDIAGILERAETGFSTFLANADLDDPRLERRHADLLIDFAAAYIALDEPAQAIEVSVKAQETLQGMPNADGKAAALAAALMLEGDARSALADPRAATAAYSHAVEIRQALLTDAPEDPEARHGLSVALERAGQALAASGETDEAQARLQKVVALREELATGASEDDDAPQRALAVAYSNLGDLKAHVGAHKQAVSLYEQAIATYDQLLAGGGNVDPRDARAEHFIRLGRVHIAAGSAAAAIEALNEAEETYAELARANPEEIRWRVRLADVLDQKGAAEMARLDLPAARAELTRSLDIRRLLADERQGDVDMMRAFAGTLLAMAEVDRSENLTEMARNRAAAALELHRSIAAAQPASGIAVTDLARTLATAAEFGIDRQANLQEAVDLLGSLQSRGDLGHGQEELMADIRGRLNQATQ